MTVTVLPGRIRARFDHPLDTGQEKALYDAVAQASPGARCTYAPRTRSALILLSDPAATQAVRDAVEGIAWPPPPPGKVRRVRGPGKPAKKSPAATMDKVKKGMAVTLGAALVAAALGREREHILLGGAFTALLGYHLYKYRKRIWV